MRRIGLVSVISGLIAVSILAYGQKQSRADLEKRRSQLLKEIDATQQLLNETKKNKNVTLSELKALKNQLNARQQLINTMNSEISSINSTISTTSNEIETLNEQLAGQKQRYAQSVRYAYKNKDAENMVAFIFAAEDFNDAIRRLQYLKKLREYRKLESDKINANQVLLSSKINKLSTEKTNKSSLLSAEEKQRQQIQEETAATNAIVNELKGKETELMAQIKKDKLASQKIQRSIENMIRQEIALAKKKAEEDRKRAAEEARIKAEALAKQKAAEEEARRKRNSPGQKTNTKTVTPVEKTLSTNFTNNYGNLPWPVENGIITIISIYISTQIINFILAGLNPKQAFYIVSNKYEDIGEAILKEINRGCTVLKGYGFYSKEERNVLFVAVSRRQVLQLQRLVQFHDPNAFITVSAVQEVHGEGFTYFLNNKA